MYYGVVHTPPKEIELARMQNYNQRSVYSVFVNQRQTLLKRNWERKLCGTTNFWRPKSVFLAFSGKTNYKI
jgi:hypothetical protein